MTQRVLITAGADGIGLAIAKAFVADGARVHITDVNAEAVQEITKQNPTISGPWSDIRHASFGKEIKNETLATFFWQVLVESGFPYASANRLGRMDAGLSLIQA